MKPCTFALAVLHLLCMCSILVAQSPQYQNSPRQLLHVDGRALAPNTLQALLELNLDVTAFGAATGIIEIIAKPGDRDALARLDIPFVVQNENLESYARSLRAQGYLDHFHDYSKTLADLQLAVALYPGLARLLDIGDSWEKTQGLADRDIWAIKISDHVELEENEPEVLIMGNHHAREIITPEIVLDYMNYLLGHYGSDPSVTYLVDHRQIWLIPTLNPDGLDYVHQDDLWWRKNRRDNLDGTFGVDLNRNYAFKWGYDNIGSSPNRGSETYRGIAAFSEPETAALRDLVNAHRFRASLSYHSYGRWMIYPWGYIPQASPDHTSFVAIAESLVAYNRYHHGLSVETVGYGVNGDSDDWLYGEQSEKNKIFALTPEVGNAFHPDTTVIAGLILENRGANLYLTYLVGEEPIVAHHPLSDTESGTGPYRVVAQILPPVILTQPVPVAGNSVFVHYTTTGVPPFQTVAMNATGNPQEFSGEIPGVGEDQQVYYFISAEDDSGRVGHAPRAASGGAYFSFHVGADHVAPIVTHQPLGNQSVRRNTYVFRATATDNTGLATVQLLFRQNTGVWSEVEMTERGQNEYEAAVRPASAQVGDRFDYYLLATDVSAHANMTRLPAVEHYSFMIINSLFHDFEPDDGELITTNPSDWEWGAPTSGPLRAFSGSKAWATKLDDDYSDLSDSKLDLPPLNLTGAKHPTFTFWHWYVMEYSDNTYWDGGNVKVSVNAGPFEIITPIGGYDGTVTSPDPVNVLIGEPVFGGPPANGNHWQKEVFDLSAYVDQTVVLRFHFGSDGFVTEPGWYIDDVEITLGGSQAPAIINTTRLRNTDDVFGPYRVTSRITDDGNAYFAVLHYSIDGGATYIELPMNRQAGSDDFSASIAGQPAETAVRYYIEAQDEDDNITRDPANAPDEYFQFIVTNRAADIDVQPMQLSFNLSPDTVVVDSLLVFNLGLLDLQFTISDSANSAMRGFQAARRSSDEFVQGLRLNVSAWRSNLARKVVKHAMVKYHSVSNGATIPWLQVGIDSALVEGEKHLVVPLVVNTAGLQAGTYSDTIRIHSNDPDEPLTKLPAQLVILSTAVEDRDATILPHTFALKQNLPNPFSIATVIPYELPVGFQGEIKIAVYNLLGQQIRLLLQRERGGGSYQVRWDGTDDLGRAVPAGIYFYRLESKDFTLVRKTVLAR